MGGWLFIPRVIANGRGVEFQIKKPGDSDYWSLALVAPNLPIAVGEYDNATRYPFQESLAPGLDFSGCHRGNNRLAGSFKVLEAQIEGNRVIAFAADFLQFEEGQLAKLVVGKIRYNSTISIAAQ